MGERITRAWNSVRRREPVEHIDARCGASGWHLSSGCSDAAGMAVCPLCSQRVHTVRATAIPRGAEVLESHCA